MLVADKNTGIVCNHEGMHTNTTSSDIIKYTCVENSSFSSLYGILSSHHKNFTIEDPQSSVQIHPPFSLRGSMAVGPIAV